VTVCRHKSRSEWGACCHEQTTVDIYFGLSSWHNEEAATTQRRCVYCDKAIMHFVEADGKIRPGHSVRVWRTRS
jgi:hypothetical protein